MTAGGAPKKLRGKPTVLPDWWLLELLTCLNEYKATLPDRGERWSWQLLANDLTSTVDRQLNGKPFPWDRKTVERFVDDDFPTEELMDAFCTLFPRLIRPTFVARSRAEALELVAIARKFDKASNPEHQRRRALLQGDRGDIEHRVKDQTAHVESMDAARKRIARVPGSRRNRRVG